jgi:tRNA-Thr(GGU) m(6)t(6)A37 methyltransferase TsaA
MGSISVIYRPIGIIHSEHVVPEETPIQTIYAKECKGTAEIFPEYVEGLNDIDGFSHLYLIYHFHRAGFMKLVVKPFLQDIERGVFSTRSPWRPNAIGISIVELICREGNNLHLKNVDILDQTPLLDIKPYTAKFDHFETSCDGWQDEVSDEETRKRGRRNYRGGGTL